MISNITSVISSTVASTISLFLETPIDKVAYVDTNNECKYVEIYKPFSEPEYRTCKIRDSSFEVVYVDPCLEKVTQDGVKSSQEKCSLEYGISEWWFENERKKSNFISFKTLENLNVL